MSKAIGGPRIRVLDQVSLLLVCRSVVLVYLHLLVLGLSSYVLIAWFVLLNCLFRADHEGHLRLVSLIFFLPTFDIRLGNPTATHHNIPEDERSPTAATLEGKGKHQAGQRVHPVPTKYIRHF
ncbi:hypothetical protein EON65_51220 [archaeon]|nr:MAG: hypothetical protein EON65_51220 [archaeon]